MARKLFNWILTFVMRTFKINKEEELFTLFCYLTVGCITALIYFALFALLWQFLGINYKLAVSITYIASVLFHFSANRRFTFKAHGSQLLRQAIKYSCMIGFNYFVTMTTMSIVVEIFHLTPYIGLILAVMANVTINFIVSRYWVFQTKKLA